MLCFEDLTLFYSSKSKDLKQSFFVCLFCLSFFPLSSLFQDGKEFPWELTAGFWGITAPRCGAPLGLLTSLSPLYGSVGWIRITTSGCFCSSAIRFLLLTSRIWDEWKIVLYSTLSCTKKTHHAKKNFHTKNIFIQGKGWWL